MKRPNHPTALRRICGVVMTAGLAAAALTVGAGPASAAQGTRPCPSYYYCFYENVGYNSPASGWRLNYQTTSIGEFNNPPSSSGDRRDQLSSIINNGDRTICIYDRKRARPDSLLVRVAPFQDVKNLHDVGKGDKADYWRVYTKDVACP